MYRDKTFDLRSFKSADKSWDMYRSKIIALKRFWERWCDQIWKMYRDEIIELKRDWEHWPNLEH